MSEFKDKWSKLSKFQRKQIRSDMEQQALARATKRMGMFATNAQLKAGAKKMVDVAISKARAA